MTLTWSKIDEKFMKRKLFNSYVKFQQSLDFIFFLRKSCVNVSWLQLWLSVTCIIKISTQYLCILIKLKCHLWTSRKLSQCWCCKNLNSIHNVIFVVRPFLLVMIPIYLFIYLFKPTLFPFPNQLYCSSSPINNTCVIVFLSRDSQKYKSRKTERKN